MKYGTKLTLYMAAPRKKDTKTSRSPVAKGIGETGASRSENCILVNAEDIIHLLLLLSHCVTSIIICLTYSLVFHLENDRF